MKNRKVLPSNKELLFFQLNFVSYFCLSSPRIKTDFFSPSTWLWCICVGTTDSIKIMFSIIYALWERQNYLSKIYMRTFLPVTSYDSFITHFARVLGKRKWSFVSTSTPPVLELLPVFAVIMPVRTCKIFSFPTFSHPTSPTDWVSSQSIYYPDSEVIFWY